MAGSNPSTHSRTSTPTSRQTITTTPSTRSTQASTAPPTTRSTPPRLRRRPGTFDLTPSPPLSDTTAWEHSSTASGPLADFARTPMYPPPPSLPRPAPPPRDRANPIGANRISHHTDSSPSPSWEHSSTATGPLADFARSGLYPPPPARRHPTPPPPLRPLPAPHHLAEQDSRFPRRYNDATSPSARPIPPSIPSRAPLNAATHFRSAQRRYPETTRRPTAMDQAQAAVQRMLDEQLAASSSATPSTRYEELPPMEAQGAGLRVRVRRPGARQGNLWVQMARVPDLGVLGTIAPFPEIGGLAGGGSEDGEVDGDEEVAERPGRATAGESVLELSEGDRVRLEDGLAEMMAGGSGEDGDASTVFYGLDGAQQSHVVAGRRTSVDSWGVRRSVVEDLADARPAEWEREDSSDSEYVLLPPFPFPENLPMYVQALHNAGLEDLDDLPTTVMQNFMRQGRERDEERNQRIQTIQEKREELSETILQRPSRRMQQSSDAGAIHLLMREINLLWQYDAHHWPTLEPLDYELDGLPREREIPSVPCWLDEPEDWDFAFNWDAPFSAARRSSVFSLVSVAQDRPVSPGSTDPGFVQAAITRIESIFQR